MPRPCKPVTVDGVEYRSIYAAALALGISRKTLEWRLKQGKSIQDYYPARRQVIINGQHYASMTQAAQALGAKKGSILYRVKKFGPMFDWNPNAGQSHLKPVTLDQITYRSIADASRATGIAYSKLQRMFK